MFVRNYIHRYKMFLGIYKKISNIKGGNKVSTLMRKISSIISN